MEGGILGERGKLVGRFRLGSALEAVKKIKRIPLLRIFVMFAHVALLSCDSAAGLCHAIHIRAWIFPSCFGVNCVSIRYGSGLQKKIIVDVQMPNADCYGISTLLNCHNSNSNKQSYICGKLQ